jgi:hypothetical protein
LYLIILILLKLFKTYEVGPVLSDYDESLYNDAIDKDKNVNFANFSVSSGVSLLQKLDPLIQSSTFVSIASCAVKSLDI